MGSGFNRVKTGDPVLVDLVHAHRGYMVDATRMFVSGRLSEQWQQRLEDMIAVKEEVVDVLDQGLACSQAWEQGHALAVNWLRGPSMGTKPDQSRFLGHSIGLQLDESPVVAAGFDRPSRWAARWPLSRRRSTLKAVWAAKTRGFATRTVCGPLQPTGRFLG